MPRENVYESGNLTDNMLLILLATFRPIHGYGIKTFISRVSLGSFQLSTATIYYTLKKMSEVGWVREVSHWGKASGLYQITYVGKGVLERDLRSRKELIYVVDTVLEKEEKEKSN